MKQILHILVLVFMLSCSSEVKESNKSIDVDNYLFRANYLPDYTNEFDQNFCSYNFQYLDEPTLFDRKDSAEVYRLTYNISMQQKPPVVIRVTKVKEKVKCDKIQVILKSGLSFKPDYKQVGKFENEGYQIANSEKSIYLCNDNYWDSLIHKMNKLDFWNQQTYIGKNGDDGASYILEGYKNGKYHMLSWRTPALDRMEKAVEFKDVCEYLYFLSSHGVIVKPQWYDLENKTQPNKK